jgi:arylsulfatase
MSDPYWYSFPNDPAYRDKVGPRNLVHSFATDTNDPTVMPRWGVVGKQRIVDEGPLAPYPDMTNVPKMHDITPKAKYDMTTFDEVLVKSSSDFMDKAKRDGKPFFIWHNTTRMHVWTFLSPKYQALMNNQSNYGEEEAGMTQMDDSIGALLKHLDDIGEADNTIVVFTTDNGAEVFTWPDGGMTPFKSTKGTIFEGGFRVPTIARWPGHIKTIRTSPISCSRTVEAGKQSVLDAARRYPTLVAAAGTHGRGAGRLRPRALQDLQHLHDHSLHPGRQLNGYAQISSQPR